MRRPGGRRRNSSWTVLCWGCLSTSRRRGEGLRARFESPEGHGSLGLRVEGLCIEMQKPDQAMPAIKLTSQTLGR
eukprot:768280-Hanusia_phi.AAC.9